MRKGLQLFCLIFLFAGMSACGYTTKSTLPAHLRNMHVEMFKNDINFTLDDGRNVYFPLIEIKTHNAVNDRFLFDGNLKTSKVDNADLILKGRLTRYKRSALRFTDSDDVEEYRVHVFVDIELWDTRDDELMWSETNFVGEATYFVTGSLATTEESAVDEAITDLARRIVERVVEDW